MQELQNYEANIQNNSEDIPVKQRKQIVTS